jgi:hypothetical protein
MKKNILYLIILLLISTPSFSIKLKRNKIDSLTSLSIESSSKLSNKQVKALAGRKLTLKEKIGLLLIEKEARSEPLTEAQIKSANSNATLGLVFGILSIVVFPLFAIPGLILSNKAFFAEKVNPNTLTKGSLNAAKAGRITSYVGLGILALTLAFVFIIIAAYGFH